MRGEGEDEFVSKCLLMNHACIIGMHNVFLCNVCVLSESGANFYSARVLED